MRRFALLATLMALSAAASAQITVTSPFLGTWQNASPITREITRMEISEVGAQIKLHLWFSASPAPHDAGIFDAKLFMPGSRAPADFRYTGPVLRLQQRFGSQTDEILIEQGTDDRLNVTLIRLEGTNSGRVERMVMRRYVAPTNDCLSYNPASLRMSGRAIIAGSAPLIAFSDARDREMGLALARSFAKICTIGRDNSRPDRNKYILEYWEGGAEGATAPTYDCIDYDPARLRITNVGAEGYRLESVSAAGASYLQVFNTLADANAGLTIFRRHRQMCFIARGSSEVRSYLK